jgi:hypothetical protein
MKKHLVVLLLAAGLPFAVLAQSSGRINPEACMKRCTEGDSALHNAPKLAKYMKQLEQIRAQKKTETDPTKLKALEEQEMDILDQGREAQEKLCTFICKNQSS